MIKGYTITNHLGRSLKVDLFKPQESGFNTISISGLGPVKGSISTTDLATGNGVIINNARQGERNIVFNIEFMSNPDIEATRYLCYDMFQVGEEVTLLFETDRRLALATGVVETNEPNIFSEKETVQVSVICPSPFFKRYSPDGPVTVSFTDLEPLFEFPFSNESLTTRMIELANITRMKEHSVYYPGDAKVGFEMQIHFSGPATNIKVYDVNNVGTIAIDTTKLAAIMGSPIKDGDMMEISTHFGRKHVKMWRNGMPRNVINAVTSYTDWPVMRPGENRYSYWAETGFLNITFDLLYDVYYKGI